MSDPNLLDGLISSWSSYPVAIAVLLASIAGSSHCLAMCGPITIMLKKNNGNIHLYNLGRLITYLFLGFVAGTLGKTFIESHHRPLSLISVVIISGVLIYLGLGLVRKKGVVFHIPNFFTLMISRPMGWIFRLNVYLRSLILGIINGFAPCGWLYVFVLASVTMKNGYQASFLMFFFWLGTVPSLTFISYISKRAFEFFPAYIGRIAGILLILAGLLNFIINIVPGHDHNLQNYDSHKISLYEKTFKGE